MSDTELPQPLLIHSVNLYQIEDFKRYLLDHGCTLEDFPERYETPGGAGSEEKLRIHFPDGTSIKSEWFISTTYSQLDIAFPAGGGFTWYKMKSIHNGEPHNRMGYCSFSFTQID